MALSRSEQCNQPRQSSYRLYLCVKFLYLLPIEGRRFVHTSLPDKLQGTSDDIFDKHFELQTGLWPNPLLSFSQVGYSQLSSAVALE